MNNIKNKIDSYFSDFKRSFDSISLPNVDIFFNDVLNLWIEKKSLFICGNGGSAGNANHIVNDFIYGVAMQTGKGINAISLASNPSVITCLANDINYDAIFSEQLAVHGKPGDHLLVLSGSGNSPNIINVIQAAKKMGIKSHGIIGFDGGEAKRILDNAIHIKINDMQISEDFQLIICHMLMQWLHEKNKINE